MGETKQHYGTGGGGNKKAMPPMSWNQLEKDANSVTKISNAGARASNKARNGNGTKNTYSNNGEFDGSAQPNVNSTGTFQILKNEILV